MIPPVPTSQTSAPLDPQTLGAPDVQLVEWAFDGGHLEFEQHRRGRRVLQVARNRYATPVVVRWSLHGLENLYTRDAIEGVAVLPPAQAPYGPGQATVLAELQLLDPTRPYRGRLQFRARWGDPYARPREYAYRLPYPAGSTFSVLQGWHGAFSHRGSNEFAVDFDCPVATPVLAARPGRVVATNASATGAGTTADWLEYRRVNFVLIQHDDGTLGEYMHLAPSGIEVKPGQWVERGTQLALSGNTGFSTTPHLHFHLMTASSDGLSARSFPFRLAVTANRTEAPMQGRRYLSWERSGPR